MTPKKEAKTPVQQEVLDAIKGAVKEAMAEMGQPGGPPSLTVDEVSQLLDEKLATLSQGEHDHGGDPDCEQCLQVAHNASERAYHQGISDATHQFEQIPGVTQLRQQYQAAQEKVSVTG